MNRECSCGCHLAAESLTAPTEAYLESRRAFLRRALLGGMTLATLPLVGAPAHADIFRPSVADQIDVGEKSAADILQKYKEVTDDDRATRFMTIGTRLSDSLTPKERGPWNFRYHVLDSETVNAFALPGGHIFLFTGLLKRIQSDDELAAVTGHEMTHVRKEHWARAVATRLKRELGLDILLGATHAGIVWHAVAGLSDTALTLSYSREEEDQADLGGLKNMVAATYDPHGMLDLFHTLQTATGNKGEPPEFLSNHPLTADRIKRTEERIARLKAGQPLPDK